MPLRTMARLALTHADWAVVVRRELLSGCAWARSYAERRRGYELICDVHGLIRSHGIVSNAQVRHVYRLGYSELVRRVPQQLCRFYSTGLPVAYQHPPWSHARGVACPLAPCRVACLGPTYAVPMQGVMLACAGVKVYGLTCDAHGVIHAQGDARSATEIGGATATEADPEEGRRTTCLRRASAAL